VKQSILLLTAFFGILNHSFGQGDYYKNLNDSLRCKQLKTALKELTSAGFTARTYDEVKFFMEANDTRPSDDGLRNIMWDMYSDNPDGTDPYEHRTGEFCTSQSATSEDVCWNREHSLPASWFGSVAPTFTDIINLIPTDAFVNNRRGNIPYGNVSTASFTSLNGSKLGTSAISGISGNVFEPIDAYKGDFARIMLYMITRWEDSLSTWSDPDANRVLGTDIFLGFRPAYLDMLLEWHENDPPSEKERKRNDATQNFQKNRNPFVDVPEFATRIWKTSEQDCINFSVGLPAFSISKALPYPNPVKDGTLMIDLDILENYRYSILDISGKTLQANMPLRGSIDVRSLTSGTYLLLLESEGKMEYARFSVIH
jgi:endonuclease I